MLIQSKGIICAVQQEPMLAIYLVQKLPHYAQLFTFKSRLSDFRPPMVHGKICITLYVKIIPTFESFLPPGRPKYYSLGHTDAMTINASMLINFD